MRWAIATLLWLPTTGLLAQDLHYGFSETSFDEQMQFSGEWTWQPIPDGLLYRSYAAGPKEPRFSTAFLYDSDGRRWVIDATVGARVGILRYGTSGSRNAEGWQFDLEGAASPRLSGSKLLDLESTDYRFGALLTYTRGRFAYKAGYTHISSHMGDEFILKNPDAVRRNYVKESFVLGTRFHFTESVDLYGEVSWAPVYDGGAKPLEFQLGAEYASQLCSTRRGGSFAATNAQWRQESDFTPAFNTLVGWQWTGRESGTVFRFGLQYYTGPTSQVQFLGRRDHLIGIGTWFDF